MSVQVDGLGDLADRLDALDTTESVDGEHELSFEELFTDTFMQTHTDGFTSFAQFLEESEWTVTSAEEFERIPGDEFDRYVAEETVFKNWESMLSTAAKKWAMRQLDR